MSAHACIDCKHCEVYSGARGWSELTPGQPGSLDCSKGHYADVELTKSSIRGLFRERDCADFEEDPLP